MVQFGYGLNCRGAATLGPMSEVTSHPASPRWFRRDDGATAVEYALMIALIGFVIIGTVSILGDRLNVTFGGVSTAVVNSGGGEGDAGGDGGNGDNNGWGDGDGGGQGHND